MNGKKRKAEESSGKRMMKKLLCTQLYIQEAGGPVVYLYYGILNILRN